MADNQHYFINRPPYRKGIGPKNFVDQGTFMQQNVEASFQLAKIVVAKVNEIETRKRKLILVADDEPLTFDLIEDFFRDAKLLCTILPASTGRMAYDFAVSEVPDLIITDWLMPELNGLDLIRQLKSNFITRDIPVIMSTGVLLHNDEYNKILAAGAVDCIQKPFDDVELIALVKLALALRDALNFR